MVVTKGGMKMKVNFKNYFGAITDLYDKAKCFSWLRCNELNFCPIHSGTYTYENLSNELREYMYEFPKKKGVIVIYFFNYDKNVFCSRKVDVEPKLEVVIDEIFHNYYFKNAEATCSGFIVCFMPYPYKSTTPDLRHKTVRIFTVAD